MSGQSPGHSSVERSIPCLFDCLFRSHEHVVFFLVSTEHQLNRDSKDNNGVTYHPGDDNSKIHCSNDISVDVSRLFGADSLSMSAAQEERLKECIDDIDITELLRLNGNSMKGDHTFGNILARFSNAQLQPPKAGVQSDGLEDHSSHSNGNRLGEAFPPAAAAAAAAGGGGDNEDVVPMKANGNYLPSNAAMAVPDNEGYECWPTEAGTQHHPTPRSNEEIATNEMLSDTLLETVSAVLTPNGAESDSTPLLEMDVIWGRFSNALGCHPGNVQFHSVIERHQDAYQGTRVRAEKERIASAVMEEVASWSPGGRFLRRDSHQQWVEVDPGIAMEKIMKALRR